MATETQFFNGLLVKQVLLAIARLEETDARS